MLIICVSTVRNCLNKYIRALCSLLTSHSHCFEQAVFPADVTVISTVIHRVANNIIYIMVEPLLLLRGGFRYLLEIFSSTCFILSFRFVVAVNSKRFVIISFFMFEVPLLEVSSLVHVCVFKMVFIASSRCILCMSLHEATERAFNVIENCFCNFEISLVVFGWSQYVSDVQIVILAEIKCGTYF